jgi:predicted permease
MMYRPGWWRRLTGLWRTREMNRGLDDEISFHIDQQTAKNIRGGMTSAEARRAALVRFGGVEPLKERTRDEFRPALIQDFWRDMRIGARMLRRAPGLAIAAILTIGLGTGAATAVFSVVNGVLLQPLPYPESDRLVRLYQLSSRNTRMNVSGMNFDDWQARTHSFAAMARFNWWGLVPAIGGSEPTLAATAVVSKEFFDVMQVRPFKGRAFAPDEQRVGGTPAVVVSHGFWQRWLGGSEPGRALRVGDRVYTVVGVMPPGFDYPTGAAVWLARELNDPDTSRTAHNFQAIARLRDGVSVDSARADISAVSRQLKQLYGDSTWMFDATAIPLLEQLTATSKPALQMLFGAALVLLLVATTNVSSLLLARAAARQQQFAIQLAIGAGRFRIARQLLAETSVLCLAGGALGVLTAIWAVRALVSLGPGAAPRLDQAQVDWYALAFALGVSMTAAVSLGIMTALATRGVRLASTLSAGSRSGTGSRRGFAVRQGLVVAQVALTLVLLAGAGLLARSFVALLAVNPGFTLDDALVLDLTVTDGGSDFRARRVQLLDTLVERIRQLPGVAEAGLISGFPLGGGGNYGNGQFIEMTSADEITSPQQFSRLGPDAIRDRAGFAGYRLVSADYFKAMGIPLRRGRLIEDTDAPESPHVAVVSESLARSKWPDQDPIGRFVQFGNMDGHLQGIRIVGVVGDVREISLETPPAPMLYASYRQRPNSVWRLSIVVRGPEPDAISPSVRRVVREINPELPVQFRTIDGAFRTTLTGRRFSLILIAVFAGSALVLATFGLYGLISYLVAQRTKEIGIRMALGAKSGDLLKLIVGKGTRLAIYGTAVGLGAAIWLSGLAQGLLFAISPTDPQVLAIVAVVTIVASVAASYVPARRATRIEPVSSLRAQ